MAKILWEFISPEKDDFFLPESEDITDFEKNEQEKYDGGGIQLKKMMNTPFGLAMVDDSMNPFKEIQILVFHTDFVITNQIAEKIEGTPGVEILKIISPYRGALAVGKCFNSTDVRREIENRVIKKEIPNAQIKAKVDELRAKLSKFDAWSILVFPNGYADYCVLQEGKEEEYQKLSELYEASLPYNNGVLIKSD